MIHLFVADLDGTLLNSSHVISQRTTQAVHSLQENGIEFLVATGRDRLSCQQILQAGDIQCATINHNGAATYDLGGCLIDQAVMEREVVETILNSAKEMDLNLTLMGRDCLYVQGEADFFEQEINFRKRSFCLAQTAISRSQLLDLQDFIRPIDQVNPEDIFFKIMVFSPDPQKLTEFKQAWLTHPVIDITSSAPDNLEITHHLAQKGLAIQRYISKKPFNMKNVACIGDSANDRSMLQMAGHSYAMTNATPSIQSIAQYLAPRHDEDGVAQVIEALLQSQKG